MSGRDRSRSIVWYLVRLAGKVIDEVPMSRDARGKAPSARDVYVSLVSHDGYSTRIVVSQVGNSRNRYPNRLLPPTSYHGNPSRKGKREAGQSRRRRSEELHVDVWEERDRLTITLYDGDEELATWIDDDARAMIEDGFFRPGRALEHSVIEYAREMGII